MTQRSPSVVDRMNSAQGSKRRSSISVRTNRTISRGTSQVSRQLPAYQPEPSKSPPPSPNSQHRRQTTLETLLQQRNRLRIFDEEGEDLTPKTLFHPEYPTTRRTAFDAIAALQTSSTLLGQHQARASIVTVSSFSSLTTLDEILAAQSGLRSDSIISSSKDLSVGKTIEQLIKKDEDLSDAPSQYHLSKIESREKLTPEERITLILRETETFFLFELAQLTEDATTEIGEATIEENERYEKIKGGIGRKILDAESQTPEVYSKSRSTYIARQERKNRSTYVNNWVMHDDYEGEKLQSNLHEVKESPLKFTETKTDIKRQIEPTEQLEVIGEREEYEDATRVTLRILASRDYEIAQKRFAGLLKQDPSDLNLKLVYELDLLWKHESEKTRGKAVATFRWNPINMSLLAVGYETRRSCKQDDGRPKGFILIWCAKNPTVPDRCYEFDVSVSDLDWSNARPNLLAVGFYNGALRVIDVSKKQLTVVLEVVDKVMPSYEPHWQVQWWPYDDDDNCREILYTSNQDGRVCCYPANDEFSAREIFQVQRIEGQIAGVPRINHCLGNTIPLSRHAGALILREWPGRSGYYLIGTEEGCVHKCSIAQPHTQIGTAFLAHDGPICSLKFSPFCNRLLLTCGADWTARIWAEGLEEPLLKFTTKMSCVNSAAWSPRNSTIFAYAVENEICIWDIRRKSHRPASVTQVASPTAQIVKVEFTKSGEQLVAADDEGNVYVYGLEGMPLPPLDQTQFLVDALQQALVTKPELLKKLQKLGAPFDKTP